MRDQFSNPMRRQSGFALISTALVILILIPVVGLSIDASVLYLVKSKLSMAVDSGALAGARALSRGTSDAQQISSAQETARAYVRANFSADFLPDSSLLIQTPNIDMTIGNRRAVTVTATVNAPLYFMRIFGRTAVPVAASGTAVRRDVNVAVVLDRSGSLHNSGSCGAVKASAVNFVNRFAEGRDNVGLVTFASSSRDDFQIASNFQTANPSVVTTINSISCTGMTNSAQALWQGYRQLVTLNQPNALNAILFFTDGQPTAFTGQVKLTGLTCVNPGATGVLASAGASFGLGNWVAPPQPMTSDQAIAPGSNGCSYAASWPTSAYLVGADIARLPKQDLHGNRLISGYQSVGSSSPANNIPNPAVIDEISDAAVTASTIAAAAVNAADSAGMRIRTGAQVPELGRSLPGVVVFSIGLGNASGGVEQDFLRRVSNDPAASNYDSSRTSGLFVYAPQTSDLTQAFNRIASEILRLAQ